MSNDPIHDIMLEKIINKINNSNDENKIIYKKQLRILKEKKLPSDTLFYLVNAMCCLPVILILTLGMLIGSILVFTLTVSILLLLSKKSKENDIETAKFYELLDFNFIENYKESILEYSKLDSCNNDIIKEKIKELKKLSKSKKKLEKLSNSYFTFQEVESNIENIDKKRIINSNKVDVLAEITKINFDATKV